MKLTVGVLGASGRVGKKICSLLKTRYKNQVRTIIPVSKNQDLHQLFNAHGVIDFSSNEALMQFAKLSKKKSSLPVLVSGTTGSSQALKILKSHYTKRGIVFHSPNFLKGIGWLSAQIPTLSNELLKMNYKASLIETHHKNKKDRPSGTALYLQSKFKKTIPISSFRKGEDMGSHTIKFAGKYDEISITHHAKNRTGFADGAIQTLFKLCLQKSARRIKNGFLSQEDFS